MINTYMSAQCGNQIRLPKPSVLNSVAIEEACMWRTWRTSWERRSVGHSALKKRSYILYNNIIVIKIVVTYILYILYNYICGSFQAPFRHRLLHLQPDAGGGRPVRSQVAPRHSPCLWNGLRKALRSFLDEAVQLEDASQDKSSMARLKRSLHVYKKNI